MFLLRQATLYIEDALHLVDKCTRYARVMTSLRIFHSLEQNHEHGRFYLVEQCSEVRRRSPNCLVLSIPVRMVTVRCALHISLRILLSCATPALGTVVRVWLLVTWTVI